MAETLESALDVRELDGIAAQLEATNQQVRALVIWAIRAPELVRRQWERLVQRGIEGHTAEVHQVRDRFCEEVTLRIKYLEQVILLAEVGTRALGQGLPGTERLPGALHELQRMQRDICERWQTVDDLYELLVRYFPVTEQELADIVKRNPPPAAWYEEDSKPF